MCSLTGKGMSSAKFLGIGLNNGCARPKLEGVCLRNTETDLKCYEIIKAIKARVKMTQGKETKVLLL